MSATDVEAGQIEYFYSGDKGLSLDHIVASGSLPPSFPMTVINDKFYWDGGIFDNTPLGAVLDRLDTSVGADRTIHVVNLFPNKAPVPHNMQEVTARTQNLQFANKTLEDVNMLGRINEVAVLMEALDSLPKAIRSRTTQPIRRSRSAITFVSRKSLQLHVRRRLWALAAPISRPRQSSSVRTKATNRPSRRCTRSKPDIYQRCRKTAKGEFAPGGSPGTSVASKNDAPGLRG